MKIKTAFAILLISFFPRAVIAQQLNERIDNITFRFSDPQINQKVIIELIKRQKEDVIKVNSRIDNLKKKSIIDTTFVIEQNLFDELVNEVVALNKTDLCKAFSIGGYDGTYWTIQFGGNGNSISYNFWSPKSLTEPRGLTDFMKLCKRIIEISGLNSENIL
jgi:hypothetical protein